MRLYRFQHLVGNTSVVSLLKKSCSNRSLPHFIIMSGIEGTGKSTCAEICALSLSCENPIDGEPCLECRTCSENLKALKANNGNSNNLAKKNMGLLNTSADIKSLIKDVFDLESDGIKVFILEEIHSLNEIQQTSLLEEIDRLDGNTYIIAPTTQKFKLIAPLRSRATVFDFNRLNNKESKLLIHTYMNRTHREFDSSIEDKILKYCKGIPRQITNLIDFLWNSKPTLEEINKFLGVISEDLLCNLIFSLTGDMVTMSKELNELISENNLDNLVHQLKEFFVEVVFYISCGVNTNISNKNKEILSKVFNSENVLKAGNIIGKLDERVCSEYDLKLAFITLFQLIRKKSNPSVVLNSDKVASKQYEDSKSTRKELIDFDTDKSNESTNALDMDVFSKFRR